VPGRPALAVVADRALAACPETDSRGGPYVRAAPRSTLSIFRRRRPSDSIREWSPIRGSKYFVAANMMMRKEAKKQSEFRFRRNESRSGLRRSRGPASRLREIFSDYPDGPGVTDAWATLQIPDPSSPASWRGCWAEAIAPIGPGMQFAGSGCRGGQRRQPTTIRDRIGDSPSEHS